MVAGLPDSARDKLVEGYLISEYGDLPFQWAHNGVKGFDSNPSYCVDDAEFLYEEALPEAGFPGVIATLEKILEDRA